MNRVFRRAMLEGFSINCHFLAFSLVNTRNLYWLLPGASCLVRVLMNDNNDIRYGLQSINPIRLLANFSFIFSLVLIGYNTCVQCSPGFFELSFFVIIIASKQKSFTTVKRVFFCSTGASEKVRKFSSWSKKLGWHQRKLSVQILVGNKF